MYIYIFVLLYGKKGFLNDVDSIQSVLAPELHKKTHRRDSRGSDNRARSEKTTARSRLKYYCFSARCDGHLPYSSSTQGPPGAEYEMSRLIGLS